MIYYLFLLIVIFSGAVKGYCGKMTSGYANTVRNASYINCVRFILCSVIGFFTAFITNGSMPMLDLKGMLIAMLAGFMQMLFVITWITSVRSNAYTMTDVFLTISVLIPSVLSMILYKGESITLLQWLGFIILFAAVLIMCSYNNDIKTKLTPGAVCVLVLCALANGLCDFSQKLFLNSQGASPDVSSYSFYSYVFASIFLAIVMLFMKPKNGEKLCNLKSFFGYVIVLALMMFLNTFFKTQAGKGLSSVQIYPVVQGAALILSALMSAIFFKEKITIKSIIGIILAFCALLIINLT